MGLPAEKRAPTHIARRYPIGAELVCGGVHLRVWAPEVPHVEVLTTTGTCVSLAPEPGGYFSGLLSGFGAGTRYRFALDGSELLPDPISRFQPDGPDAPSEVIDPRRFRWNDRRWRGPRAEDAVVYELHVGTFTREGTWAAARRELTGLAELGITIVEVMPVSEFNGSFGWGYDGVFPFAPYHHYGTPDDFRAFVDRAHALGLGVILDVVYNHLGPQGNVFPRYSQHYLTRENATDWGDTFNFDGWSSEAVREMVVSNARYWIDEFHLDGLRLDATQDIHDTSPVPIVRELVSAAREAAGERRLFMVAENEPQNAALLRPPDRGGYGLDAVWNDDFHHSATVAATGRSEAYYSPYRGTAQELVSSAKWGYLYQGQFYQWQNQPRGTPAWDVPPHRFVHFLQNHDQIANSARGDRGHQLTQSGVWRALTALLLLSPQTPMLFQGQEFGASTPFLYFADHAGDLAASVRRGRLEFLAQFDSLAHRAAAAIVAEPCGRETFEWCRLDHGERHTHRHVWQLHRDLLALRRKLRPRSVDGAVLGDEAFVLRFFDECDALLLVNLGRDLHLAPLPEPLLSPPEGAAWQLVWSSESPEYGGAGTPRVLDPRGLHLLGRSAMLLGTEEIA